MRLVTTASRYLSPDPVLARVLKGTLPIGQPYAYADDNPIANTDPTGSITLKGKCHWYQEGLRIARSYLGCDGTGVPAPQCGRKLTACAPQCGTKALCLILTDGTPPIDNVVADLRANGVRARGTSSGLGRPLEIDAALCDERSGSAFGVARNLIHEALHYCSDNVIGDAKGPCSAACITATCMQTCTETTEPSECK